MAVTTEQVDQLYGQLLGRQGQDQYLQTWADSGMSIDQIAQAIADSPEGQAYAQNVASAPVEPPPPPAQEAPPPPPPSEPVATVSRGEINTLYQDLFGRDAQDSGAEYWMSQVESGAIAPENLRDTLISSAQGSDVTAYSERGTRLQQQSAEEARTAAEARYQRQLEQQKALAEQARLEQKAELDALRQQQEEQQRLFQSQQEQQQQLFQNLASTSAQGKGGAQQQQQQPLSPFGNTAMQETPTVQDTDTGGGYYRNPYASGFGMGYQDPYASMRYMPQSGLMGPSGFGGKGGYRQPMPYGGMSPGKGGYYGAPRSMPREGYAQTIPGLPDTATAGDASMAEGTAMAAPPEATTPAMPMPSQMYPPMYPMRPMYPMYGGKGGYYR